MREIKFRCWDKSANCWVGDGATMDLNYSGRYNALFFDNDALDIPKDVEWVQFTGLTDKNGKEIYEGDIVKATLDFGPAGESEHTFAIAITPWGCCIEKWNYDENRLPEVIGNIYENPELVK